MIRWRSSTSNSRLPCFHLWFKWAEQPTVWMNCRLSNRARLNKYLLWRWAHPVPGLRSRTEPVHEQLSQRWSRPQTNSHSRRSRCRSMWWAAHRQTTQWSRPGFFHSCWHWRRETEQEKIKTQAPEIRLGYARPCKTGRNK